MGRQIRFSLIGIVVVSALLFAGCYPFQGDVTLLLTPVPQGQAQMVTPTPAPEQAPGQPAAGEEQAAPSLTVTVNVRSLRVRQGPSTDTPIVAGLREGAEVTALGRTSDAAWVEIQVPDVETTGWVAAEFVTVNGDVMALPVIGEEAAPAEAAPAAEEAVANAVVVTDQAVENGAVTVAQVNAAQDGWIVIHADDAGAFGEVIGYAHVDAGANENVVVEIDTVRATPVLYAMLHVDAGEAGVYEFPGPDGPVIVDGAPVSPTFQAELATAEQPAAEQPTAEASATEGGAAEQPATEQPAVEAPATEGGAAEQPATEQPAAEQPAAETPVPVSPVVVEGPSVEQLAQINFRSLRVRSAPSLDAEVVGGAKEGEVYPVAGVSEDGEWVSIYFPGLDSPAWVAAGFVELMDVPLTVHMGLATVNTGDGARLRLRNQPSLEGEIVGRIADGETVLTTGVSPDGEWVLLFVPDVSGPTWAAAQYLVLQ